jgi:GH24 family phage-related lysozyme (muramidase)
MIDPNLQNDVEGSEGCKLAAYQDPLGFWTIGWGHLIPPNVEPEGLVWTQQQADDQLVKDLESAAVYAAATPEWTALDTPCRQNAVIELCFNMRSKWLLFVKCRAAIRAKSWQDAHDALLNSLWATQVHAVRAERLADYLLTGEYPSA